MKHKKLLICLVGIVVIFLCFAAFSFRTNNDEISLSGDAKVLEFNGNNNYSDEIVKYHYKWEKREKVGEDKDYYHYKVTDSDQDYNVVGYVQLKLDEEHVNGSADDLKIINSEFEKILSHKYNDTSFENLNSRDSASAHDGINYAEDLNYSAYDGSNAYITIYDENGEVSITKKLDEFFFTCTGNKGTHYYVLGFDSIGGDMMEIYRSIDDDRKAELCMIFNSTNGTYALKIPLECDTEEDAPITRVGY